MKKPKAHPNFYRFPKPIEGTIIVLSMILFYFTLFDVNSRILDYFGPLGMFGRYMNKNYYGVLLVILYAAILAHVIEAIYAGILCRRKGISPILTIVWVVQTLLIGFPSLLRVVEHNQTKKKK